MSPDGEFDVEADIARAARSIMINRHRDIPVDVLDDMIQNEDGGLQAEYQRILDQMHNQVDSQWQRAGVKIFEVTESADGEIFIHMGRFAGRYAIVNAYNLHYVPNRPRRTSIAPWTLNYGGPR